MRPLSNQQRLHLVNTQQLYENYLAAYHHARSHAYGMRWKVVRGVTFEPIRKRGFRAANAGQFMVDLIAAPRPMHAAELVREYMPHLRFDEMLTPLHGDGRAMGELLGGL